jgi:hypothetical protein
MRKIYAFAALLPLLFLPQSARAVGSGAELGTGARAMSFAGNHTAVANDLSAVYWNPAALAFLPVREFQVSFDGMRIYGTSYISGNDLLSIPPGSKMGDSRDRMRLSGIGAMTAIPTVQGGLTMAASFDRPYIFDDFTVYTYQLYDEIARIDSRLYGDLNRWSGALGVQVAPKIAAGLTLSLITGTEKQPTYSEALYYGFDDGNWNWILDHDNVVDVVQQYKYLGYALTLGALCYPLDILSVGVKIDAFADIRYVATQYGRESVRSEVPVDEGRAYSAPSGALGVGLALPWLTAALDIRVTMPYTFNLPSEDTENMPDVQAKYFKFGAGLGLEAPLASAPAVLRAGYSFDHYDLFNIVNSSKYGNIEWDDDIGGWRSVLWDEGRGFWPDRNRHTLSAGVGLFTSGIGLELSYAYQTWGLRGVLWGWDDVVYKQRYSSHRVMAAVIYRY